MKYLYAILYITLCDAMIIAMQYWWWYVVLLKLTEGKKVNKLSQFDLFQSIICLLDYSTLVTLVG
uniref:Uncharacterized protein n=1 Tax=Aegilops tauschii subsp. strangulata TaxID=200361 RepID=A0A452YUF6_AEGTS